MLAFYGFHGFVIVFKIARHSPLFRGSRIQSASFHRFNFEVRFSSIILPSATSLYR